MRNIFSVRIRFLIVSIINYGKMTRISIDDSAIMRIGNCYKKRYKLVRRGLKKNIAFDAFFVDKTTIYVFMMPDIRTQTRYKFLCGFMFVYLVQ